MLEEHWRTQMIPQTPLHRQMLRTDDTARIIGLSPSTLAKLRLTGGGPRYIKLGRTVVYDPADVEAWLSTHRRLSTSVHGETGSIELRKKDPKTGGPCK